MKTIEETIEFLNNLILLSNIAIDQAKENFKLKNSFIVEKAIYENILNYIAEEK